MTHDRTRTLQVQALARVEGEGAMLVRARDGKVELVELQIYEPPRFFEAFLRGRDFTEVTDITARICGICPVAYQMSACNALEQACGVVVDGPIRDLRRLLYCGEWLESHALHVYFLHAPDFLGFDSVVEMAAVDRSLVEQGIRIKKAGNDLLRVVGGRSVHPINVKVGGFHRMPTHAELAPVAEQIRVARDDALATVRWAATLDFPDFEQDYTFVALQRPDEYAVLDGRLAASTGLDVPIEDFGNHITEHHVEHSNALHARLDGDRSYMAGPMARFALNGDRLSPLAREIADEVGLTEPTRNPFQSIIVRAVELVHACDEALQLIDAHDDTADPSVEVVPRRAVGHGASEAPRGLLYHSYEIDDDGSVLAATIIPPTSQNQAQVEDDLRRFVEPRLDMDNHALTHQCEQAIRNYDPCISCATHFLDLTVVHE